MSRPREPVKILSLEEQSALEVKKRASMQQETLRLHQQQLSMVQPLEPQEGKEQAALEEVSLEVCDQLERMPSDVCAAFSKLQTFAREVNFRIPTPEVVVVGPQGYGKSSLLEAFFGHSLFLAEKTSRVLQINVVNNQECDTPKCLLKRDTLLKEYDADIEVSVADLPAQISARSKVVNEEPIVLQYEHKSLPNMTIFDTPGLLLDPSDPQSKQVEETVSKWIQPNHRFIVLVRPSSDATIPVTYDYVLDFVKCSDPELTRTTIVYTHFFAQLQMFQTTKSVNKYLACVMPGIESFFVTLPPSSLLHTITDPDSFSKLLLQANRRDLQYLESLHFNQQYQHHVGVPAFSKHLLDRIWKSYNDNIPSVLKHLKQKKIESQKLLDQLHSEMDTFNTSYLRVLATNHIVDVLKIIERLLTGTAEGNPGVWGQTLDQEKAESNTGVWVDSQGIPMTVEENWDVKFPQNKVYGGQQLERLFSEFKAVSTNLNIEYVTSDDVISGSGLHSIPNNLWAACDLARQKSESTFAPLIDHLTERATYIVTRLYDIAEQITLSPKKKATRPRAAIEQYPYFVHHCKDLYTEFVESQAQNCKQKCLEEFYPSKTVYWDLTESNKVESNEDVVELTKSLFEKIKARMTRNILLKFLNFFFLPLQSELWTQLHSKINGLPDKSLEDLFEVGAMRDKMFEEERKLRITIRECDEKESVFLEAAVQFSHPTEEEPEADADPDSATSDS